jgi:hypothetical protein
VAVLRSRRVSTAPSLVGGRRGSIAASASERGADRARSPTIERSKRSEGFDSVASGEIVVPARTLFP